jgi:hypothetical protein
VTLEQCEFIPMQEGEIAGMPTFHVRGKLELPDGQVQQFDGNISIETDGRDIEWEGTPETPEFADWETNALGDIADAIWKTPAWKEAEAAHGL